MQTYTVSQLLKNKDLLNKTVTVQGWARTRRDSKAGLSFIALNDGSCFANIQIIASNDLPNYQNDVVKITTGCSLKITGKLLASPAAGQACEIQAENVTVIGWVEDPETYPISPKHHSFEYLRSVAHLRPRTNTFGAVARVRHTLSQAIHRYFHENGFYWIHTPIITSNDCEGAGELFKVSTLDSTKNFFGRDTFLTVSGQLNVEPYCCSLSKVYTFGPAFRAENSNTSRHLAEFWMIEPEIAFADLNDDIVLAEGLLKYILKVLLDERADDMVFFNERIDKDCIQRISAFLEHPFEIIEYTDAIEILKNAKKDFTYPVQWGMDLQSEHERYLAEDYVKRPVAVTHYPKGIKAFYMRQNDDGKTVAAMDILAPGIGEIVGGSQREERLERLDARLDEMGISKEDYSWYRDLRRYGSVPHAGFGLGFERLISYATGIANVRDVIPYPRTPDHAEY